MFQNGNFQFSKCRLQELHQVRNKLFKASMKYYVLNIMKYYVMAIQVSNDCTSTVKQILQYLPDEALLELTAATYGDRFYNKSTFSQTKFWLGVDSKGELSIAC